MKQSWTVPPLTSRKRLDIFLSEELPDMSRSHIAKLLKNGAGRVNKKPASVHEFLQPGDRVEFDTATTSSQETKPQQEQPTEPPPLIILKETPDWIVINKPSGVLVHPDKHIQHGTLIDALIAHDPKIAKIGEDPERPGIMHRLDKEASGLMVIARTQTAFDDLKHQFAQHSVEKKYIALVYGTVIDEEGDIKFRIARSKTKQRMAARPTQETEGKAAWTHFKTLKRFHNASLLELDILSGRTHQIRAHLFAYNHPIIGDPLYTRKSETRTIDAPRLMLQSVHLSFIDPTTGQRQTFDLPPEKEFDDLIKLLA